MPVLPTGLQAFTLGIGVGGSIEQDEDVRNTTLPSGLQTLHMLGVTQLAWPLRLPSGLLTLDI